MKKLLWIVILLQLVLASGLPENDPRFDRPVVLSFAEKHGEPGTTYALPLNVVLETLVKSIGMKPLIYHIYGTLNSDEKNHEPNWPIIQADFGKKTFREIWNFLFATYGTKFQIDYLYIPPDTILIAPVGELRRFELQGRQKGNPRLLRYKVSPPLNSYLTIEPAENGGVRTSINLEGAKNWFEKEFLPHLIGEIGPISTNWLVTQESKVLELQTPQGKISISPAIVLFSVYGSTKQHEELRRYMKIAGIPFELLAAPPPPEPLLRKFYQVAHIEPEVAASIIKGEYPSAAIRVVPKRNILIIHASEENHSGIRTLLEIIDKPLARPPIYQRTFKLSHAKAEELANVLQDALQAKRTETAENQAGQPSQDKTSTIPSISIVADNRTNTLIATGTAEQLHLVEELIKKLDVPSKLVKLKIKVYTVNKSVSDQLGIDWDTIAGGNLAATILDGALKLIFDSTRSLASLNIVATLHALAEQNLAKQLSDAVIYVENNYGFQPEGDLRQADTKAGELQVGGKLLLPIKAANGEESLREFNVGLTLRFWAQVASPDEVILELYAQTGGDPTNGPQNSILVPKKSLLTRFRIKNGQTLVLGGLTEEGSKYSEKKVPFLGDIPLIGALFKSAQVQKSGDELIVTVTPEIVESTGKAASSTP